MKIDVTQQDIDQGVRCEYRNCPIALALMRELGRYVSVVSDQWYDDGPLEQPFENYSNHGLPLPEAAQQFVKAFDHSEAVEPFSFEIEYSHECNA